MSFIIVEVEDGFIVVELPQGAIPAGAAAEVGGMIADEGPFATFEEATDAIADLEETADEDRRVS